VESGKGEGRLFGQRKVVKRIEKGIAMTAAMMPGITRQDTVMSKGHVHFEDEDTQNLTRSTVQESSSGGCAAARVGSEDCQSLDHVAKEQSREEENTRCKRVVSLLQVSNTESPLFANRPKELAHRTS
jgi:hypothetical protein